MFIYYYVAWEGRKAGEPHLDSGERIEVNLMPLNEVQRLVTTRSGDLGESMEIFEKISKVKELTELPEFQGQEVEIP
jgi:hypothetical protein